MEWNQPKAIRRFRPKFITICILQETKLIVHFEYWPNYSQLVETIVFEDNKTSYFQLLLDDHDHLGEVQRLR